MSSAQLQVIPEQGLIEQIVEAAPVAMLLAARDGRMAFVNAEAENLFGYSRNEMLGQHVELLLPVSLRANHEIYRNNYFAHPIARPMCIGRDLRGRHKDGNNIPIEVLLRPIETSSGLYVLGIITDVTERRRLERRFEIAIEAAPIAMLLIDMHGRIVLINRETEKLYGYRRSELIGQSVETLVPERFRVPDTQAREHFFNATIARRLGTPRHEFYGLRKDGSEIPIEVGLNPIPGEEGVSALITVTDITERKRLEDAIHKAAEELERRVEERTAELARANRDKEKLLADLEAQRVKAERLSREDPLTQLANRREFDERLDDEIRRAERYGTPVTAAMFDLDHFKRVNDRFGHALGDAVLREAADLMRHECRTIDVVARYGGEEFALALPGSDLQAGIVLCERIRVAFEKFDWNRLASGLAVRISAGVSAWSTGMSAPALLAAADSHLYEAKRRGRNRVVPGPDY